MEKTKAYHSQQIRLPMALYRKVQAYRKEKPFLSFNGVIVEAAIAFFKNKPKEEKV